MSKQNVTRDDLDSLLQQAFKDDLPPEAEAGMARHFRSLASRIDEAEDQTERSRRLWLFGFFRKEILAFASLILLISGGVAHLSGNHSVLAHSIERLKMVVTVSAALRRATSMDCTMRVPGAEHVQSSFRVRWIMAGATRVDANTSDGGKQTLWIPDRASPTAPYARFAVRPAANPTPPRDAVWRPVMEFLTPAILAQHMEEQYGLTKAERRDGAGRNELLFLGRESQQAVEITIDAVTYLPSMLKKCPSGSGRIAGEQACVEALFRWNRPIARELFAPKSASEDKPIGQ